MWKQLDVEGLGDRAAVLAGLLEHTLGLLPQSSQRGGNGCQIVAKKTTWREGGHQSRERRDDNAGH